MEQEYVGSVAEIWLEPDSSLALVEMETGSGLLRFRVKPETFQELYKGAVVKVVLPQLNSFDKAVVSRQVRVL